MAFNDFEALVGAARAGKHPDSGTNFGLVVLEVAAQRDQLAKALKSIDERHAKLRGRVDALEKQDGTAPNDA